MAKGLNVLLLLEFEKLCASLCAIIDAKRRSYCSLAPQCFKRRRNYFAFLLQLKTVIHQNRLLCSWLN